MHTIQRRFRSLADGFFFPSLCSSSSFRFNPRLVCRRAVVCKMFVLFSVLSKKGTLLSLPYANISVKPCKDVHGSLAMISSEYIVLFCLVIHGRVAKWHRV